MSSFTAFTDGACKPNPGTGGYGVVLLKDGEPYKELSGAFENTTNNQMELAGVIAALDNVPVRSYIVIISDSKYVVNTLNLGWKRNANIKFWEILDNIVEGRQLTTLYQWVKGHADSEHNNRADELAQEAAFELKEKNEELL